MLSGATMLPSTNQSASLPVRSTPHNMMIDGYLLFLFIKFSSMQPHPPTRPRCIRRF